MRRERLFIDLEQARFSLLLGSGLGDAGDLLESFAGCAPSPHELKEAITLHPLDQQLGRPTPKRRAGPVNNQPPDGQNPM